MANSVTHFLDYPIANARYSLPLSFRTSAGTPTDPTSADTELSSDGGASFADCAEEVTTGGGNGMGYLTLSGAETNNRMVLIAAKSSNCLTTPAILQPRVLPILSSGTLSAGSSTGGTLGTILGYDITGCYIRTTGGTGGGGTGGANNQARRIITYTQATGAFTVPAWETTPDATTTYDILLPEGATFASLKAVNPTTPGRTLDVTATGAAGVDWGNVENQSTTVNLSATTIATVTNQLTAAAIATGVWQDTTSGDFTVSGSIGKSLFTAGAVPGAAGGLFIAGSNAATTISGLTTGALACTTITASGAVAFQSTFAVTTSTSFAALSCTTLTASGAVAFQSTFVVTTSTSLAALSCTTLTASGVVAFQSTFTVTGATSLAALSTSGTTTLNALTVTNATTLTGAVSLGSTLAVASTVTLNTLTVSNATTLSGAVALGSTLDVAGTTTLAAVNTGAIAASGTVTFNAFTVTNALTVSGSTTFTGAIVGSNASNNLRINGVVPGANGGLFIAGTNAATTVTTAFTTTFTGNLTGNVGGNVTGSVGSLATQAKTDVENATWDTVLASHLTAGSTGFALNAAGSAGDPWGTALPGAYAAGTAGFIIGTNLNATVGSRSTYAGGAVASVTNPVTVGTNNDKTGYSLTVTPPTAAQIATAVLTTAMTESYNADGSPATLAQASYVIMQMLTEISFSGTTATVKRLDGVTTAYTLTINDASLPTSITRST